NTVSPTVVPRNQRRRSTRSAMAPPTGENRPMGRKAAAATMPVHRLWCVFAVTRAPTATVCIHDPTLETRAALQIRAKLRWRSGRSDENATLMEDRDRRKYSLLAQPLAPLVPQIGGGQLEAMFTERGQISYDR